MLLPRSVTVGIALLVAVLTLSMTFYGAIGDAPRDFFGGEQTTVAFDPRGKSPIKGEMSRFLARDLEAVPGLEAVSPELLSPALIRGEPVMVRGAEPDRFLRLETARIVAGEAPGPGEAMVGRRVADRIDVGVGDPVVVAGSYVSHVTQLRVSGIYAGAHSAEELVVPPATARTLTGTQGFHFIRARTDDPVAFRRAMTTLGPYITPLNVTVDEDAPRPGDQVRVHVGLKNWGRSAGQELVTLRIDGRPVQAREVRVDAQSYATASFDVRLVDPGDHRIEVNPEGRVTVQDPEVRIDAPRVVPIGDDATLDLTGNLTGVRLTFNGSDVPIRDGRATIRPTEFGRHLILARRGNATVGAAYVSAVHRDLVTYSSPVVLNASIHPAEPEPGEPLRFAATVLNEGGRPLNGTLNVYRDGRIVGTVAMQLGAADTQPVSLTFPAGSRRGHRIEFIDTSIFYDTIPSTGGGGDDGDRDRPFSDWYPGEPSEPSSATTETSQAAVADDVVARTVGDVRTAVFGLSVVTAVLVLLGLTAVVGKALEDRRRETAIVRALGADRWTMLRRVLREGAPLAAAGSLAGVAAGAAGAWAIGEVGLVRAFGRTVQPALAPTNLAGLAAAGAALTLVALLGLVWRRVGGSPAELFARRTTPAEPGSTSRSRDAASARFPGSAERLQPIVLGAAIAVAGVQALGRLAMPGSGALELLLVPLAGLAAVAWLDLLRRAAPSRPLLVAAGSVLAAYGPLLWIQDPVVFVLPLLLYALAHDRPVAGLVLGGLGVALVPASGVVAGLAGVVAVRRAEGWHRVWPLLFLAEAAIGLVLAGPVGPALLLLPAVGLVGRLVCHHALHPPAPARGRATRAAAGVAVAVPAVVLVGVFLAPDLGDPLLTIGALVFAAAHLPLLLWALVGLPGLGRLHSLGGRALTAGLVAPLAGLAAFLPQGGEGVATGLPFLVWPMAALIGLGYHSWTGERQGRWALLLALSLVTTLLGGAAIRFLGHV